MLSSKISLKVSRLLICITIRITSYGHTLHESHRCRSRGVCRWSVTLNNRKVGRWPLFTYMLLRPVHIYYSSFLQLDPIVTNAKQIGGLTTYHKLYEWKFAYVPCLMLLISLKIQSQSSVDVEWPWFQQVTLLKPLLRVTSSSFNPSMPLWQLSLLILR